MHELARGIYRRECAVDVFMTVMLGRSCHEWVTTHPAEAIEEGWAISGAEYRRRLMLLDEPIDNDIHRVTITHMQTPQRSIRISDELYDRVKTAADRENRTFSQQVQYVLERFIELDQHGPLDATIERPEPPTTWSSSTPVQRPRVNPVTGLPYGPTPKGK